MLLTGQYSVRLRQLTAYDLKVSDPGDLGKNNRRCDKSIYVLDKFSDNCVSHCRIDIRESIFYCSYIVPTP